MFVKPNVHLVARLLIRQHGADCRALAIEKAAELDQAGNVGGLAYWRQVIAAIDAALARSVCRTIH